MFAIVALFSLTVLSPLMMANGSSLTGEGSPLRQGSYFVVAALIVYGLRAWARPQRLLAVPLALMIALGWCWLSILWAIEPGIAMRRLVLTTVVVWSIFAAVEQVGYEQTLPLVRMIMIALLIANFVTVFLWPDVGIHQADEPFDKNLIGDWRGIMTQKNFAGATCALTVLLFLFDASKFPIVLRVVVVAASGVFLWKTGSRTSLGDCVGAGAMGALFMFYNARWRMVVIPAALIGLLTAASLSNVFNDPINSLIQNKATLSGRVEIWDMVIRYCLDHVSLGAGYGSFWNIGPQSPAFQYGKGWLVTLASGHNGFLDLMATIGIPGLAIVVAASIVLPIFRLLISRSAGGQRGALILSIIMFCAIHNATESSLFDRDMVPQVFLMLAVALLWTITAKEQQPGRIAAMVPWRRAIST